MHFKQCNGTVSNSTDVTKEGKIPIFHFSEKLFWGTRSESLWLEGFSIIITKIHDRHNADRLKSCFRNYKK